MQGAPDGVSRLDAEGLTRQFGQDTRGAFAFGHEEEAADVDDSAGDQLRGEPQQGGRSTQFGWQSATTTSS